MYIRWSMICKINKMGMDDEMNKLDFGTKCKMMQIDEH